MRGTKCFSCEDPNFILGIKDTLNPPAESFLRHVSVVSSEKWHLRVPTAALLLLSS